MPPCPCVPLAPPACRLKPVGNILGDILAYKRMMESVVGVDPVQGEHKAVLKEMGLKALQ